MEKDKPKSTIYKGFIKPLIYCSFTLENQAGLNFQILSRRDEI